MNRGKRKTNMSTAVNHEIHRSAGSDELELAVSNDSAEAYVFPDSFFRERGSGVEFFDESVREALRTYEMNPSAFTPREELLVLQKFSLSYSFGHPAIADANGVYEVADQFLRIARQDNFPFRSELGRQFSRYCLEIAEQQDWSVEYSNGTLKPVIEYDGEVMTVASEIMNQPTPEALKAAAQTTEQEAFSTFAQ